MVMRPANRQVNRSAAALFGLIIAVATVALVVPLFQFNTELEPGDVATRTFTAQHATEFQSETLTDAEREERARAVPEESLPVDTSIRDQQVDRAARYLDTVRAIAARSDLNAQQKLKRHRQKMSRHLMLHQAMTKLFRQRKNLH